MVPTEQVLSEDGALHLLDCNSHIIVKIIDLRKQAAQEALSEARKKELENQSDELQERLAENLLILTRNESLLVHR